MALARMWFGLGGGEEAVVFLRVRVRGIGRRWDDVRFGRVCGGDWMERRDMHCLCCWIFTFHSEAFWFPAYRR